MRKASKLTSVFNFILRFQQYSNIIINITKDKTINRVGITMLNIRVLPRQQEVTRLGRSTKITDSNGKIIEINFQDLDTLEYLGRGQYGSVTKVKHRPTKMVLAAKVSLVLIYFTFSKFYF